MRSRDEMPSAARKEMESWGRIVKGRLEPILAYGGKRVLDAGCSKGDYVSLLCAKGYDAYGFDASRNRHWETGDKSRFLVADLCHMPFEDSSFDTICCFEVLEHVKAVDEALRELHRVARRNLIISVPDCEEHASLEKSGLAFHHWVDRSHQHYFTQSQIRSMLEQLGFEVAELKLINPIVPEILLAEMWRLKLGRFLSKVVVRALNLIPFRKKLFMTILVVANKGAV